MPILSAFKATSFRDTVSRVSTTVKYYGLFPVVLSVFLFAGCSSSSQTETYVYQCFYDYMTSKASLPEFDARLFWSPDSTIQRLDIYISVREARLKYSKDSNSYRASYSSVVRLLEKDKPPITKEVDRTVRRRTYPGTNDNSYDAFLLSFDLISGEYSVELSVTDNDSKAKSLRIYRKNIPDISRDRLDLSDVMLLARYDSLGQGRRITPFILSNAGLLPDTLRFFTAVSSKKSSVDSIFFDLYRLQGRWDITPNYYMMSSLRPVAGTDPCVENVDTILVYHHSASRSVGEGYSFLFGSVPKPPPGSYLLKVVANDEMNNTAVVTLPFQVHNLHFPDVSDDLGTMVKALNYIASSFEIRRITEVKTDSAVKSNLLEFWKQHGGYDKMAQYYQRIAQANRLFTNCTEGWKTPMGMIYVVCGEPDNVDCEGIWDETWSYIQTSSQSSMTIVFRLTRETDNPEERYYGIEGIYSNADLWSYYVNQWRNSY